MNEVCIRLAALVLRGKSVFEASQQRTGAMPAAQSYRFFLSYSWENRGTPLKRLFNDLVKYVRDRVGGSEADIAFQDRITMKSGDEWPEGLLAALQSSQTLVYLLSIDYVRSEWCGRELQAFLERAEAFKTRNANARVPRFILPVLWIPPVTQALPSVIERRLFDDGDFPEEYGQVGLESLAKQRDRRAYDRCVKIIGDRIIAAASESCLPPLSAYKELAAIPNAFAEVARIEPTPVEPAANPVEASVGPTEVKCVYVAGSTMELRSIPAQDKNLARTNLSCYGEDGWYWQPFNPPVPTAIGSVVQQMLTEYRYREVPVGEDIRGVIEDLRAAADRNQIILLIVDAWSASIERYRDFLREFDASVPWNNAVIVPWNDCDEMTKTLRAEFDARLRVLFRSKYPSPRFRSNIRSLDEFRSVLLSVLEMIRSEIETLRAASLRIQGPPLAQIRTSREQQNVR